MTIKCPLKSDFDSAAHLGIELTKTMRRIRRKINYCDKCELVDSCGIRDEFNSRVDGLIHELNEEWGLMPKEARSSKARAK